MTLQKIDKLSLVLVLKQGCYVYPGLPRILCVVQVSLQHMVFFLPVSLQAETVDVLAPCRGIGYILNLIIEKELLYLGSKVSAQ